MGKLTEILLTGQAVVDRGAQEPAKIVISKSANVTTETTMTEEQYLASMLAAGMEPDKAKALAKALAAEGADQASVTEAMKAALKQDDAEAKPTEQAKAADSTDSNVVYKSVETGAEYTADHDPAIVALAKQNDELIGQQRKAQLKAKYPN